MNKLNYLNAGCGAKFHSDWTNIDLAHPSPHVGSHNLLNGIPYKGNTFDVVYNAHFLEHLPKESALEFIKECARVLKPGGIVRIVVPDLENIAREYLRTLEDLGSSENSKAAANYNWVMLELFDQFVRTSSGGGMAQILKSDGLVNKDYVFERMGLAGNAIRDQFRQGDGRGQNVKSVYKKLREMTFREAFSTIRRRSLHLVSSNKKRVERFRNSGEIHQWMYDRYSLKKLLQQAEFENTEVKSATESDVPDWNRFQLDSIDGVLFDPVSLFMEARKRDHSQSAANPASGTPS